MSNEPSPKCPRCGAPLPENAPAGLCPNCLMTLNLQTETTFTGDAPTAQKPLPPEQIAAHFPQLEILECLGRGGMGVVYKARQKSLNRPVALKLLAPERVGDAKFAERFAREAQALAALNHPNIVTVYDFGQAGGFYYLLMEYVDGANLRRLLRERRFTPEEALAIVPPLCDALQYAHDRGIVHRDIKPENLLLDKAGRVKIADFGIAKMLGLGDAAAAGAAQPGNATQTAIGTPGYSAPEQLASPQRVDRRADIYSLGVVFYELLTGELPGEPIEPPSRRVRIDARLDEVVLRALENEPERRYQHASQVKTDVQTIASTPAGAESASPSPSLPGQAPDSSVAIQVFAVLKIIFGVMGILCCSPYTWLIGLSGGAKVYAGQPLMLLLLLYDAVTVLPLSCVTLTLGIGLWYRKSWARKISVWKAIFDILFTLFTLPIWTLSALSNTIMSGDQKLFTLVIYVPLTFMWLVYFALLIYFLTRTEAKRAVGESA